MIKIKRALISVYNKTGLVEFAKVLVENGITILSTGGTANYLTANNIPVVKVENITGAPEILDGRVKTLHPTIHGGILARRNRDDDMRQLKELGITPIDMVVVNFYPFEEWSKKKITIEELLEYIDIGGPTMVRAAAKNFPHVVVVPSPDYYELISQKIKEEGGIDLDTSKRLAFYAFSETAKYDALIANYLAPNEEGFKKRVFFGYEFKNMLRYGENPHQRGAFYKDFLSEDKGFARLVQLNGKELSYNNYQDMEAAWKAVSVFSEPAAVVVKHMNPCGISINENLLKAYKEAVESDPISAFGGIVAINREITREVAEEIIKEFREVVIAPSFSKDAVDTFAKKPNLRVIKLPLYEYQREKEYKKIWGGMLVQDEDLPITDWSSWKVVAGENPDERLWEEIAFSFQAVALCRSNAIVISKGKRTIGIGMGLPSRIDAAKVAIKKAGEKTHGAVLASDAFFPFPDVVELAAKYGIKVVVEPGGSIRDEEVIKAAKKHEITLIFTGERHFRH